jgi:hypothetical protein
MSGRIGERIPPLLNFAVRQFRGFKVPERRPDMRLDGRTSLAQNPTLDALQLPAGVVNTQIVFGNRDQLVIVVSKISNDCLLHHQVTSDAVELLHQHQPDTA